jgi:hypothetical protein
MINKVTIRIISITICAWLAPPEKIHAQLANCNTLPSQFQSYEEAHNRIGITHFSVKETLDTSKSSWIRSASYMSCNGKLGFLVFQTKSKTYIHQDVPIAIWRKFKCAQSYGAFWNSTLKNKYKLQIKLE